MVEHGFRKAGVESSNLSIGCSLFSQVKYQKMNKTDTTPDAHNIQYDLYRRMSPAKKIELIFDAYRTGQLLAMASIRMLNPAATDKQVWYIWAKRHLGEDLYNKVYGGQKNR